VTAPRVFAAIPTTAALPSATVRSLLGLVMPPGGLAYLDDATSSIAAKRNHLVQEFLASACTHLLFLDSDMTWPPALVQRLLAAQRDIVGGLYWTRQLPPKVLAGWYTDEPDPERFYRRVAPLQGLQAVDFVGTGALLIARAVLTVLPPPWFAEGRRATAAGMRHVNDDESFCERARAAGYTVWVDTDVVCGHVASVVVDGANAAALGWER